ncbi:MAG TPA: FAD-binding oxidoreductase [Bryobacteraceae bacterium]|nr:FAD-binding oxidoreductase [Bryobacteraceae bacterium]
MKARLIESYPIAAEVKHFTFDVPEVQELRYTPGQFVSFTGMFDGREITRAYSTASAPNGNRFELCLNRVQDGLFSPHLFEMQPGDTVERTGPLGYFTWREPVRDSVLVATGTGIAPFRGMLQWYLPSGGDREITLLFGVRFEESLLYREDFEALAARYPNFKFCPTLTRPTEGWTGRAGRIQPYVLEAVGSRRDIDVYMCGMKAMIDDMRTRLKALGLDRKQIIVEKYD